MAARIVFLLGRERFVFIAGRVLRLGKILLQNLKKVQFLEWLKCSNLAFTAFLEAKFNSKIYK